MKYEVIPTLFHDFDSFFKPMAADYFLDEDANSYSLSLDMPGVKKSDLQVETNQGNISIKAESKNKGKTRSYHRTFKLPEMVKTDAIEAELTDGVLTLVMPKKEERKPKLIQIK